MNNGPVTTNDRGTLREKLMSNPELTLPSVAAAIPKEHTIRIIHENYEDVDYSEEYDLVGISCFTMFAPQVYEIADKFRKKGITVILGGYHPTALPKEAKQHADSVVIGEAELTFPRIIDDWKNNKLHAFYKADRLVDSKEIPPLRRDLLNYHPITDGITFSRGCYNRCEFCSITNFYNHTYRKRPINNVIKELKSLSRKVIMIHDANLTADLDYSTSLFKEMIKSSVRKKWFANGTIYILGENEEFLQLAKKAGCIGWTIGFESFCQESLDEAKKFANKVEKYQEWIKVIRKNKIGINGLFMFGFDHDKQDIFDKTITALSDLEIDVAEFNIITPLPGTPLFEKMKRNKRLLTKNWEKYTQTQVVFKPKNMTPEELYAGTRKVIKSFYSPSTLYKRWIRLLRLSADPIQISTIVTMDYSRKIWYKKEFGI